MIFLKDKLERIYSQYNKREYINPDPLLFLYDYPEKKNREIAGFIAACLAYGRVELIMETVATVLAKLDPNPFDYLIGQTKKDMANDFKNFQYRFAKGTHLVNLLWGIREVLKRFSSLENCFYEGMSPEDETIIPGLVFFFEQMNRNKDIGHLLADPQKKSACKRSLLFLRWMVRKDQVDPGGWEKISPSLLIVPLDTHMHKIGIMLEFTKRKSLDMKTALEITQGFKQVVRQDPVKYDFCLTRFGIRRGLSMDDLSHVIHGYK
ncbi:MAG: TIGR02757 family protein [Deltaproteobacteria bacterium]|uniref:TIGR02757 family protein n=1 Tax=Desulfobacula sp. TaxID=2593537 RepID=UPI001988459E|nr:TIGR02757 family protein [Candidatus Desulfobacula maris]MBL6992620.1 TIGR02757 family protein [Desulfobacula sp.]